MTYGSSRNQCLFREYDWDSVRLPRCYSARALRDGGPKGVDPSSACGKSGRGFRTGERVVVRGGPGDEAGGGADCGPEDSAGGGADSVGECSSDGRGSQERLGTFATRPER